MTSDTVSRSQVDTLGIVVDPINVQRSGVTYVATGAHYTVASTLAATELTPVANAHVEEVVLMPEIRVMPWAARSSWLNVQPHSRSTRDWPAPSPPKKPQASSASIRAKAFVKKMEEMRKKNAGS